MWKYRLENEKFLIHITGGSVKIWDKATGTLLKEFKGYQYVYTGDIHPEGKEFFALENDKHFYVFSLETLEPVKRVTLPRGYDCRDMLGFYSPNGKSINIPVKRYVYEDYRIPTGHYEVMLCKYSTEDHSLQEKIMVGDDWDQYGWHNGDLKKHVDSGWKL